MVTLECPAVELDTFKSEYTEDKHDSLRWFLLGNNLLFFNAQTCTSIDVISVTKRHSYKVTGKACLHSWNHC